jgi:hypothetical protein
MNGLKRYFIYFRFFLSKRICNRIEKTMYSMFNATKISTIWMGNDLKKEIFFLINLFIFAAWDYKRSENSC